MKRGAGDSPKMHKLARLLGCRVAEACGLVSNLLDWAYYQAQRGDVGKWDDADIARGAKWEGALPAAQFVEALVRAGWLDRHGYHRLVVHALSEHADDTWRKQLLRKQQAFADLDVENQLGHSMSGQCPDIVRMAGDEVSPGGPDNVRVALPGLALSEPSVSASPAAPDSPRAQVTAEEVAAVNGKAMLPFRCPPDLAPTPGMLTALAAVGCTDPIAECRLYALHWTGQARREIDWTETGPRFSMWVARHAQLKCAGGGRGGKPTVPAPPPLRDLTQLFPEAYAEDLAAAARASMETKA